MKWKHIPPSRMFIISSKVCRKRSKFSKWDLCLSFLDIYFFYFFSSSFSKELLRKITTARRKKNPNPGYFVSFFYQKNSREISVHYDNWIIAFSADSLDDILFFFLLFVFYFHLSFFIPSPPLYIPRPIFFPPRSSVTSADAKRRKQNTERGENDDNNTIKKRILPKALRK